jgi:predicted membrane-bound mannosyltransferase
VLLNMIVPMSIAGGAGVQSLRNLIVEHHGGKLAQLFPAALSVVVLAICFYQPVQLSFFHYDDDRYIYPYAQTRRDFLNLVAEINLLAGARGGMQTPVAVLTPDYWPLPWYLRDYRKAAYFGKVTPTDFPIVVGSLSQMVELQRLLAGRYQLKGWYPLRPGVDLVLYVANETTP